MEKKSLFNTKNSFRYVYIFIILINILTIYFMYDFINNNVLKAIAFNSTDMLNMDISSQDINMAQFEKIIQNIKDKTRPD